MLPLLLACVASSVVPTANSSEDARWAQLRAAEVYATSFLQSNWNKYNENYHPNYVLDDDPATAWVEGAEGDGEGESITVPLSPLRSARGVKLQIRNGYQKSEALFKANAAPREVEITLESMDGVQSSRVVTLERAMGWQDVEIPADGKGFSAITLSVRSVYPGSKYKDTCLSDLRIFVDSDVPYNAAQEANKHEQLLAWAAARLETARYFAALPPTYPFAVTLFESEPADSTKAEVDPAFAPGKAALSAVQGGATWHALAKSRTVPAYPDGLYLPESLLPLFTRSELSFFETDQALASHEKDGSDEEMWSSEVWRSSYKIEWASPGVPRRIYFWEKSIEEGRGTYEYRTDYVAEYDDAGKLRFIYGSGQVRDDMGPYDRQQIWTFSYDGAGRITGVEERLFQRYTGEQSPEYPVPDYAQLTRFRAG